MPVVKEGTAQADGRSIRYVVNPWIAQQNACSSPVYSSG